MEEKGQVKQRGVIVGGPLPSRVVFLSLKAAWEVTEGCAQAVVMSCLKQEIILFRYRREEGETASLFFCR